MQGLLEYSQLMIMPSTKSNRNSGPPPPITKLTLEQDLKLRQLELKLNSGDYDLKDFTTIFVALQHQNFVMANSIKNLLKEWPKDHPIINEDLSMFGILLETKDWSFTSVMLLNISAEQVIKIARYMT